MRLAFGTIFADAAAIWRADRDLLIALGAFFFVLPALALTLFMPQAAPPAEGERLAGQALLAYIAANWHWIAMQRVVELFGVASLFALCLDRARPTLGAAMGAALRLFPLFLVLAAFVAILTWGGLMLFFLPGFYVMGRSFVAGAAMVAERQSDPFAALARGFALTHGHGWMLFTAAMLLSLPGQLVALLAGALRGPEAGIVVIAATGLIAALAGGAVTLATALLQIAAYRRLAGSSNGT
ncbi:hypothetical protein [Sphingomonas sp.]|uniref:hypothetical protein n=1 Tax=Sphingomonas sp. TaxID=28214 RepID=UPI002EDAD9B6